MNASNPKHLFHVESYRRALTIGLGAQLLAIPSLRAQENPETPPPENTPQVGVLAGSSTVTGTRITAAEAEGTLSVTTIVPTALPNSGFVTTGDMLRVKLPQFGGTGVINEGIGNGGDGSQTISLRGLPGDATLLLVNGRRTSTSDLNLIPQEAIERIDVLNDGGGVIYGTDAVAGVVNVILKENFNGFQFDIGYANTTETSIDQRYYRAIWGVSTENTSFILTGEYMKSDAQMSVDRERSKPLPDAVSSNSNPGTFFNGSAFPSHLVGEGDAAVRVPDEVALRWTLKPGLTPFGLTSPSQVPAGFDPLKTADTRSATSLGQANTIRNSLETELNSKLPSSSPVMYGPSPALIPSPVNPDPNASPGFPFGFYTVAHRPQEQYGANTYVSHKIFGDHLTTFANVYYMRNQSENQLAPSPLGGFTLPASNYWFNNVFYPGQAAPGDLRFNYRPLEIGPRTVLSDWEAFHVVAGLGGQIADSSWKWGAAYLFDRVTLSETQTGGVIVDEYDRLLGLPSEGAFNPFSYTPVGSVASPVNPISTINGLKASGNEQDTFEIQGIDFNIGGNVVNMPAGTPATVLLGMDYNSNSEDDVPDYAIQNGLIFPFNTEQPLHANRTTWAGYAEMLIPVFGKELNFPVMRRFDVTAALRGQEFSDVQATGVKPRVSFHWEPLERQVTVRGSWAQGFIAPGFSDLYQLPAQDFTELYNPVTGSRLQPEDGVLESGNPELKPSTSVTWLIGTTYSPDWLKGFSANVQYYKIEQEGIPFQSAQYIVNQWFANGPDSPGNPFGPLAGPSVVNPTGAQVELVDATSEFQQVRNVAPINTGKRNTDGIDFWVTQELRTGVGTFTVNGRGTRVLTFEQEDFPGAGQTVYLGRYWANGAALDDVGFPEWRTNISLDYSYKRFAVSFSWNYVGGYTEDVSQQNFQTSDPENSPIEPREVSSYSTFDFRIKYLVPRIEAYVTLGMNNFTDTAPPLVYSSFENGYDRRMADIRQRMWFVALSKKF